MKNTAIFDYLYDWNLKMYIKYVWDCMILLLYEFLCLNC